MTGNGVSVVLEAQGETPIRYTLDGSEPTVESPLYTELTGLAGGQLQLRLIGAGAVGPGAEHLAADGLLAHQRGRAVRVPQAQVAGAPAARRLQQLLLGRAPQERPDSGPAIYTQHSFGDWKCNSHH